MRTTIKHTIKRSLTAVAAWAAFGLPLAAAAAVPGHIQLQGTITAVDGKYDLHVLDRHGNVDDVSLHRGTIINPTGLTLRPGMRVTVVGDQQGATLAATEIDTPYHITYLEPSGLEPLDYWGGPFWGTRVWF